jgi:hypothetical protein
MGGQFIFQQVDRLKEGETLSFPFSLLSDPELSDITRGFTFIAATQMVLILLGFLLLANKFAASRCLLRKMLFQPLQENTKEKKRVDLASA